MSIDERKVMQQLASAGFEVQDTYNIPPRPAELCPVPDSLDASVAAALLRNYPTGLYKHQSAAIEAAIKGEDVVLASATASGKSLPFITIAGHLTSTSKDARVLALYPAKALIQDQLTKWRDFLGPLGIRFTYIYGDVPVADRLERLDSSQVALLTPDVTHAWLMSHLSEPSVRQFLNKLRLLILDEAHVYEGAFGTNMAFLLRRLRVAAGPHQLICSTATLGKPADFVTQLTGRRPTAFGPDDDGAPAPGKTVLRATCRSRPFDSTVHLLGAIANSGVGRFLAFADSRRAVEQFVAATIRSGPDGSDSATVADNVSGSLPPEDTADLIEGSGAQSDLPSRVLPYRAGYEAEDRERIQESLGLGELAGVVATSALELGLDIGDIELVLLLDVPPSVKSFWQRIGRAGRKTHAVCVVLDPRHSLGSSTGGLDHYMARPVEPNWLYLENRYIQYAHALCAAIELSQLGIEVKSSEIEAFQSLPEEFRKFLDNELHQTEGIPMDLYPLKQRAQDDPHHEFAIRGAIEQDFKILAGDQPLGHVTYSQALREAYPGGVYYYMARPHRVYRLDAHRGEIRVKRERRYTTVPISQTMVFPRFEGGIRYLRRSDCGFVAEVEMQVSERVVGFVERRGSVREQHEYRSGSSYSQRPLTRFFETTGVCWSFPSARRMTEQGARRLLETFALSFGVQERDLGVGVFHAKASPLGAEQIQGLCLYDATAGSLRLTQRLAGHFSDVVAAARDTATGEDEEDLLAQFSELAEVAATLRADSAMEVPTQPESSDEDWVTVIAPGETAILVNAAGTQEVEVIRHRFTPRGLVYDLPHRRKNVTWTVPADTVQPIWDQTKLIRVNLVTGETIELN
jgi:DEAD/DEAH box helicase domain-containing protein